jgi:ABC-2 type transport system permease protein
MFIKELHHITRDSRSLLLALAMPVMMLLLYGYALEPGRGSHSRPGVRPGRHLRQPRPGAPVPGLALLRHQRIRASVIRKSSAPSNFSRILIGVVIPRDFGNDLESGHGAEVQLLVDGSDSNTARSPWGTPRAWCRCIPPPCSACAIARRRLRRPVIDARMRVWYNSSLESKNYVVPGTDRGDPDDPGGPVDLADHRPRVGNGDHGAGAFHAAAAHRDRAGQDAGVLSWWGWWIR